jgi:hypothetical protein
MKVTLLAALALVAAFAFGTSTLTAATMTLNGTVSDSMCGAHHPIADAAACTRACVAKGADYALVVGDKVYTLKANDQQKAELSKYAGKMAMVTGDVNGTTVTVTTVKMGMAKK